MRTIRRVVVHWSVTDKKTTVQDLRRMHVIGNGWSDIGYHRVILHPDSDEHISHPSEWWQLVKLGRPIDRIGAHALGHNSDSIGVVVVAHPSYGLDPLQEEALKRTVDTLCRRYGLDPKKAVYGHKDLNATACPGPQIYKIVQGIKRG